MASTAGRPLNDDISKSSAMSATPLNVIDLPDDVLLMITDIINHDEVLLVGAGVLKLVLAHRRFLKSAEQLVAKHQHYIKTYRHLHINASNLLSKCDSSLAGAPPAPGRLSIMSPSSVSDLPTTLNSPLMVLVEMHKDCAIAHYVRSITYTPPSGNLKHAPRCSKSPLELFDGDEEAVNVWGQRVGVIVDHMLPEGATVAHKSSWLEGLWQQDNGYGLNMLLRLLPRLESLSLVGPERRWHQGTSVELGFRHFANTLNPSSVRKLSFHDIASILKSFHSHFFPALQEIEIHCNSRKVCWVGYGRLSYLDVPSIKITGYRQNPVCLAVAIAAASEPKFSRLECTFKQCKPASLKEFLSKYEAAIAGPKLLPPKFSSSMGNSIQMGIQPDCQYKPKVPPDLPQRCIAHLESEIGRWALAHDPNKLGENAPMPGRLRTMFEARKRCMLDGQAEARARRHASASAHQHIH